MRTIRYILTAVILMVFSVNVMAQSDDNVALFEQELKEKNADVKTICCSFVQYSSMAVLENIIKKEGDFYFQEPDNMFLAFDDGDYIKMDSKKFEMKAAGNVSKTNISSNPMLKRLSAILSTCITADLSKMTDGFNMELVQEASEWRVTLKPQKAKAAARIEQILIVFDRNDMSLKELKMVEASGDYTQYEFFDKEYNKVIDSQIFE